MTHADAPYFWSCEDDEDWLLPCWLRPGDAFWHEGSIWHIQEARLERNSTFFWIRVVAIGVNYGPRPIWSREPRVIHSAHRRIIPGVHTRIREPAS